MTDRSHCKVCLLIHCVTNGTGYFWASRLAPGDYRLRVTNDCFPLRCFQRVHSPRIPREDTGAPIQLPELFLAGTTHLSQN